MIRINLLGVARPAVPKVAGPPPTAARQVLVFVGTLIVAGVIVGFFYWYWTNQINELNKRLAAEKREAERLAQIRAQNQRYQQQLQQLESRNRTIDMLLNSKVGPVDFMTALGNTVNTTNDLYLLTVVPEGERIVIRGQSNRVESIADFITALNRSGSFDKVHLRNYFQDDQYNRMSFKFSIDCVYKPPAPPAVAQPAPTPAAPARRAGM